MDTDDDVEEPPWHHYSVALSVGSVLLLGAALLVGSITAFPAVGLSVAMVILVLSAYSLFSIGWIRRNRPEDESDDEA